MGKKREFKMAANNVRNIYIKLGGGGYCEITIVQAKYMARFLEHFGWFVDEENDLILYDRNTRIP
jgi:hypothetical protein